MNSNYKHSGFEDDDLRSMAHILKRKKWLFIVVFAVVLITGVVLSYLKPSQYSSSSTIRISDNYIYYDDYIYRFYPDEAENLWIFPVWKIVDIEKKHLDAMAEEVVSSDFVEKIKDNLNLNMDVQEIKGLIEVSIEREKRTFDLKTYAGDSETAYRLNQEIISLLIQKKSSEKQVAFEDLLSKINIFKAENLEIIDGLNETLKSADMDYFVKGDLDRYTDVYRNFDEITRLLVENKEFFVNRLEVIKNPEPGDVNRYTTFNRDVIISLFAALAIGLIIVFAVNYFQSDRKQK